MAEAFICDAVRTPIGRFGGALASVRTDDLGAVPIRALMARHPKLDWSAVDDVIYGNANQAGEDNRNVARMSALLAGLPDTVSGVTVNRLCGSGLEAVAQAARLIRSGDADLVIAGGVERHVARAPLSCRKPTRRSHARQKSMTRPLAGVSSIRRLKKQYGVDAMPETAENLAEECQISREDQDAYAWRSQQRAARAMAAGWIDEELVPAEIPQRKGDPLVVNRDEHPRPDADLDKLARLPAAVS